MLLERPGEVVSREQLSERLWPNGTIIEFDHGINTCIRRLRAVLNDSAEQPRYIETLHKRGYRFIFKCEDNSAHRSGGDSTAQPAAQYVIGRQLGAGSMGLVHQATDMRLCREVALKFPREEWMKSARQREVFERESRAAAALNHPNICTVYGIGEQDGRPFIAMELLDGETLEAIIRRRELRIQEVVTIARQLASALDAAHTKGIVHRDLKPSNIFVLPGNVVKVVDFGIAKFVDRNGEAASAAAPAGTLRYVAPEQLQGGPEDPRSDLYSLGIVLRETLGEVPSPSGSLSNVRSDAPRWLTQIVNRCLERDPSLRWQSANEVITRLDAAKQLTTDRKWLWVGFGVVCLVLSGTAELYLHGNRPPDSIAVLPFANSTGATDTGYLSDGISEGIINNLSATPKFKVIARTTAFRFRGQEANPQTVGRQLGVQAILTGKVSQHGNVLTVQADLVKTTDGSEIWGHQFQRTLADVQMLQGEIAREIVECLKLRVTDETSARLTRRYTNNPDAYQLYLKGMYSAFTSRIDYLQQAIAKDPRFSQAYVALAATYGVLAVTRNMDARIAFDKQRDAAVKALTLDDSLAEAHLQMALSLWFRDWDVAASDREFRRAIELNGNLGHAQYGQQLAQSGRAEASVGRD